jgi:hypothetical protein
MSDTTGKALLEHWTWAAEKGLMNRNTAHGLRSACSVVLGALDDGESVDVKTLDVEEALMRFQNLKMKKFKPTVLETYKRRFRQAVLSYLMYLDDPGGWKPRVAERATNGAEKKGSKGTTSREPAPTPSGQPILQHREMPQVNMVDYPFPLREGQIARLILPRDLKTSEVKRLNAFMSTLAVDYEEAKA